jgi:hypothetical protein
MDYPIHSIQELEAQGASDTRIGRANPYQAGTAHVHAWQRGAHQAIHAEEATA